MLNTKAFRLVTIFFTLSDCTSGLFLFDYGTEMQYNQAKCQHLSILIKLHYVTISEFENFNKDDLKEQAKRATRIRGT